MRDYIPDMTERFPEGRDGIDMCEPRDPWDEYLEFEEKERRREAERREVGKCILSDDQRTWLDDYPRHYWVSCYSLLSGMQGGDTIGAHDDQEFFKFFHMRNPESEIADYGCFEEMED